MAAAIHDLLIGAVAAHRAGKRNEAAAGYAKVLSLDPANADALNLSGVLADETGDTDRALALFGQAVQAHPGLAEAHFNLGNVLARTGDVKAAIKAYETAVRLKPAFGDAWLNFGALLSKQEMREQGIAAFRQMTKSCPKDPRGYFNLGRLLIDDGQSSAALSPLQAALALDASSFDVNLALGDAHADLNQFGAAVGYLETAVGLRPNEAGAQSRLGHALVRAGRISEGQRVFAAANAVLQETPKSRQAFEIGVGNALRKAGDVVGAMAAYERGMLIDGESAEIFHNMAEIASDTDRIGTAIALEEKAVALQPDDGRFIYNLGLFQLKHGRLAEGWDKFEQRFYEAGSDIKTFKKRLPAPPPYWNGENLRGRRILLWREQGLGDEIMCASMIPDVIAQGAACRVMCSPRLAAVLQRSFPGIETVAFGSDLAEAGRDCDFQLPIGSLGRFFRRDFAQFPKHAGYLKADPAKSAALRGKYQALAGPKRIVGVSWRSRNERLGAAKSAALADWADLLRAPDAFFVSLQYGDCAEELAAVRAMLGIDIHQDASIDAMGDLDDFFAQVSALDAVVSTSNTTVHAAGALNVPTCVLLPSGSGAMWYWFLHRADSPWYPSLKLLRQPPVSPPGEALWREPLSQARAVLAKIPRR